MTEQATVMSTERVQLVGLNDFFTGLMRDDDGDYIIMKVNGKTQVMVLTWEQRAQLGLLTCEEVMRQDG